MYMFMQGDPKKGEVNSRAKNGRSNHIFSENNPPPKKNVGTLGLENIIWHFTKKLKLSKITPLSDNLGVIKNLY